MRLAHLSIAVLLVSLLSTAGTAAEAIHWLSNLEHARHEALKTNRPILVHFWGLGCEPCENLEQRVYAIPEVGRIMEANFVLVKVNATQASDIAKLYGVDRWPTDVILAPDGRFVARLQCPQAPGPYLAQLAQVTRGGSPLSAPSQANAHLAQSGATGQPISNPAAFTSVHAAAQGVTPAQAPMTTPVRQQDSSTPTSRVVRYDFTNTNLASGATAGVIGSAYQPYQPANPQPYGGFPPAGSQPPSVSAASFQSDDSQQPLATQYQQQPSQHAMVPAQSAPPVGLDGYCPVQLMRVRNIPRTDPRFTYTKGDPRYGVVHRGRTYLFSGPAEQQEFLRDPDRFSPVVSGYDPVLFVEEGRQIPGTRDWGVYFGDRIYLFATEETRAKFNANKQKYVEFVLQAQNPGRGTLR
jgi:protein disulfide-isomerase